MDLIAVSFAVDIAMLGFCLLASKELIPIPNCSICYFHSNDANSLKSLPLKKKL